MKKVILPSLLAAAATISLAACGSPASPASTVTVTQTPPPITVTATATTTETATPSADSTKNATPTAAASTYSADMTRAVLEETWDNGKIDDTQKDDFCKSWKANKETTYEYFLKGYHGSGQTSKPELDEQTTKNFFDEKCSA